MANINQSLDEETLELIADDYGVEIEQEVVIDEEDLSIYFDDETEDLMRSKDQLLLQLWDTLTMVRQHY